MVDVFAYLDSPELWKSVAFCLSACVVVFPVYRLMVKIVKKKANFISSNWEEALRLRRDSEELLWQVQSKNFHKETERKKVVQSALKEARQLKQSAQTEQEIRLNEKKQEILERVQNIRQSGLVDLKERVVHVAVDTTADILIHCEKICNPEKFIESGLKDLAWILEQKEEKNSLLQAIQNN